MARRGLLRLMVIVGFVVMILIPTMFITASAGGPGARREVTMQTQDIKPFAVSRFLSGSVEEFYIENAMRQSVENTGLEIGSEGNLNPSGVSRQEFVDNAVKTMEKEASKRFQERIDRLALGSGCKLSDTKGISLEVKKRHASQEGARGMMIGFADRDRSLEITCSTASADISKSFSPDTVFADVQYPAAASIAYLGFKDSHRSVEGNGRFSGLNVNVEDNQNGRSVEVTDADSYIPTDQGYTQFSFDIKGSLT